MRSVEHLRQLLQVAAGGVVFTMIQKFLPEEKGVRVPLLSDRHNVVILADEAHRSQYDLIDGLARNMRDALPNASFIGFTGTPIEKHDANTRAVFGDCVSIYDIERAVRDGATVPIYYESRICVDLYNAIVKLRPNWHNEDDDQGVVKIVMTGSASDEAGAKRRLGAAHRHQRTTADMPTPARRRSGGVRTHGAVRLGRFPAHRTGPHAEADGRQRGRRWRRDPRRTARQSPLLLHSFDILVSVQVNP